MVIKKTSPRLIFLCLLLVIGVSAGCANGGPASNSDRLIGDDLGSADDGTTRGTTRGTTVGDEDGGAPSCGAIGEACCPGSTECFEGECADGLCASCGNPGESCCPGAAACPGGGVCTPDGVCGGCGAVGERCCPGALCDGSVACVDNVCGGEGSTTADGGTADGGGGDGGATECAPGESERRECGRCGVFSRLCDAGGAWGAFGECIGQGECMPGERDASGRDCTAECEWDSFVSCNTGSCPRDFHVVGILCDTSCTLSCASAGYNAVSCAPNDTTRFTACGGNCPIGYRATAVACEAGCYFDCAGAGYNAVVCEPA